MSRGYTHLPWIYQDKEFTETPRNYESFVYLIEDTENGKLYIGKKSFWSTTKVVNEKGKKVNKRVESEWKKYYSSNPEISKLAQGGNGARFKRTILHLCVSKGTATYLEAREIMERRCLEKPNNYYNYFLELRVNSGHLKLGEQ